MTSMGGLSALLAASAGPSAVSWTTGAHLIAGLALVLGLVLWLAGGRLMKPAFVALGALIGLTIVQVLPAGLRALGPGWMMPIAGAVVGMLVGWLAFRVLVANTLALVMALAGTLAVASFVRIEAGAAPGRDDAGARSREAEGGAEEARAEGGESRSVEEWIEEMKMEQMRALVRDAFEEAKRSLAAAGETGEQPEVSEPEVEGPMEQTARAARAVGRGVLHELALFWNEDLDARGRGLVLVSLMLGYLGGLVLGFALPTRAAAVTTAMIGSAVWLSSAGYFAVVLDLPIAATLGARPSWWLVGWGGATVVGCAIQVLGARKHAVRKA